MSTDKQDRLYNLIKELDRIYERAKYYNDAPTGTALLEAIHYWRTEAREAWNGMDDDGDFNASEKEDLIDTLTNECHKLRREKSKEVISHGDTKTELAQVKAELEQIKNDYLMFQSALIGIVPKEKIDAALKMMKKLHAALDDAGKDGRVN